MTTDLQDGREELRQKILLYMRKENGPCCTWWFRKPLRTHTRYVRAELMRMERAGIVVANRESANNTIWTLTTEVAP